ncbi:MAG: 4'-phosphopantetheinyl transferase family protein [Dermatophilaceae bacterium]
MLSLAVPGLRGPVTARLWVLAPSPHAVDELTGPEQARWARLRERADRDRFATGAVLLRHALRTATGDPTAYLTRSCPDCGSTDHGAPRPAGGHAGRFGISLSHSADRVVVVVTSGLTDVGVDVEPVGRLAGLTALARVVGTPREASRDLAADRPEHALATRWVRKEAVLKAAGIGVRVAMTDLRMSDHDEPAHLRRWHRRSCPPAARLGVQLVDLGPGELGNGYVGALAVFGSPSPSRERPGRVKNGPVRSKARRRS